MKIEVANSTGWPGIQFVVRAESDSDRVVIGQVQKALSEEGKGRPWIHGCVFSGDLRAYTSFNFGWMEEKYFTEKELDLPIQLRILRATGWTVAVHNDYHLEGKPRTFWLFTHRESGTFLKGEGATDEEAVKQVFDQLAQKR